MSKRVRTSRTSAEPHSDDTLRLPCFATRAPAAAAITQAPVEMFTDPMPSPPVPTMSTTSYGVSTVSALERMLVARPASSSEVSPAGTVAVWARVRRGGVADGDTDVSTTPDSLRCCTRRYIALWCVWRHGRVPQCLLWHAGCTCSNHAWPGSTAQATPRRISR